MNDKEKIVIPGDIICEISDNIINGDGTYILGDHIYAGLSGILIKENIINDNKIKFYIKSKIKSIKIPKINDIIIGRITKITSRVARINILSCENMLLESSFHGIIRQRDVRQFDIDSVEMWKCFRPGDIVKAKVISLGDARSYILSTAENELGVILAKNLSSGIAMIPISWQQMQCPKTLLKEYRKVILLEKKF